MQTIQCFLPDSVYEAIAERAKNERVSLNALIASILFRATDIRPNKLFQVSTSAALTEGLYQGAIRVAQLMEHGDFGLGTFVDLDGEMIALDGACYQAEADGRVTSVERDRLLPYAVVTRFEAQFRHSCMKVRGLAAFANVCDALRETDNVFYAFRVDGVFGSLRTRVMRPVTDGTRLKDASGGQAEFELADQEERWSGSGLQVLQDRSLCRVITSISFRRTEAAAAMFSAAKSATQ